MTHFLKRLAAFVAVLASSALIASLDKAVVAQRKTTQEKAEQKKAQKMEPYGFEKVQVDAENEVVFTNHFFTYQKQSYYWSGVSSKGHSVPAATFGQFEIDIKSQVSVYVNATFTMEADGKKVNVVTPVQSVIPDGQYHRFVFNPQDIAQWKKNGRIISWSLRMQGYTDNGKIMGFRNPRFENIRNLIPGASQLVPGKTVSFGTLRPVGQYELAWHGSKCPGVTLRFHDHLMNEIPHSKVVLAPGQSKIAFSAPEPLIYATATVEKAGEGLPVLTCTYYKFRYMPETYWRGLWIWSRHIEKGPDYAYVWFEREFDTKQIPEYAVLGLMADDLSVIYLNGEKIGTTPRYSIPGRFDLTGKLKSGKNVLSVRVYNLDSAAGLCADLYMRYPGGKEEYLLTDKQWKCKEMGKKTEKPTVIDAPVVELGSPATTPPWISGIGFVYVGPRGRFALKSAVNGEFTANLDRAVVKMFRTLTFERRTSSGKCQKFLLPANMTKNNDGTVTVRYPAIRPVDEPSKVYLTDMFWMVENNRPVAELPATKAVVNGFQKAEFVDVGKRTRLKFRGRLYDPTFYMTSQLERMAPITKVGMHNYLIGAPFEKIWRGVEDYDFSALDIAMETLLTVDPEAIFMLDIRFYMPEWWLEAYPDDASAYFEGTRRNTYDDVQALGSKRWLTDSEAPMKAIFDHVKKTPFAERIWGVNIGDSRGNEWFWGGATAGTDFYRKPAQPGYSKADYVTFRQMLKERYKTDQALAKAWNQPEVTIATAKMPDHNLRRTGSVGSLFDLTKDAQIMDWCRFRNYALGEAIIHFAKRIKFHTDNKLLVGCYYGYMTELSQNPNRSQLITGHNAFLKCIKSNAVDFFRAPSRYTYRRPGLPCGIMQTFSTFTLRNKVVYIENDERTAYGPSEGMAYDIYCGRGTTAIESVGQINREFGMFAATGTAQYWLDHPKGSLYEPALDNVIGEQLREYAKLPLPMNLTPVEVAVVGDIESIYYSTDGTKGIFASAIRGLFTQINYLGIPFHSLVIDDLLDSGVSPAHKLYIMLPTLVLSKEQRQALMKRFEAEKATVLWLYAAGSSYPTEGPKASFCGDFLGLKCIMETRPANEDITMAGRPRWKSFFNAAPHFYPQAGYDGIIAKNAKGRPLVVSKSLRGATHIFATTPDLPRSLLDDLLNKAEVFRYVKSTDDACWIGNDLVTIHVSITGTKRIYLPNNRKMKAILGPLKGTIASGEEWNAVGGLTYVFQVLP